MEQKEIIANTDSIINNRVDIDIQEGVEIADFVVHEVALHHTYHYRKHLMHFRLLIFSFSPVRLIFLPSFPTHVMKPYFLLVFLTLHSVFKCNQLCECLVFLTTLGLAIRFIEH